jgi:hypothetical protein
MTWLVLLTILVSFYLIAVGIRWLIDLKDLESAANGQTYSRRTVVDRKTNLDSLRSWESTQKAIESLLLSAHFSIRSTQNGIYAISPPYSVRPIMVTVHNGEPIELCVRDRYLQPMVLAFTAELYGRDTQKWTERIRQAVEQAVGANGEPAAAFGRLPEDHPSRRTPQ